MRTRHNIVLDERIWRLLKDLKKLTDKSISSIVEEAIKKHVEALIEKNPAYKLLLVPEVDDEENEEITKALDALTPEDLEIVESEEI